MAEKSTSGAASWLAAPEGKSTHETGLGMKIAAGVLVGAAVLVLLAIWVKQPPVINRTLVLAVSQARKEVMPVAPPGEFVEAAQQSAPAVAAT